MKNNVEKEFVGSVSGSKMQLQEVDNKVKTMTETIRHEAK